MLDIVGVGAMGRVIRAYDPKLQREVAVKQLHDHEVVPERADSLIHEARSMAKLLHPNVVAVFDVGLGGRGEIAIVMEFVVGRTLRDWVRAEERRWEEIVDVFVAAGKGLAAAHRADILHRDFKPANVLVSSDGVAKVADFGLARGAESQIQPTVDNEDPVSGDDFEFVSRTGSGRVCGTPRYMAPEQHLGGEALTPAADQYAFCLSLWEALAGESPFGGAKSWRVKLGGPPAWTLRGPPSRLGDVLCRGLHVTPEERWPSMDILLRELLECLPKRQWKFILPGVALGVLGLGGGLAVATASIGVKPCTGAARHFGELWGPDQRGRIERAFARTKVVFAGAAARRTSDALEDYAEQWSRMSEDNCRATRIYEEQSEGLMDLRSACLRDARTRFAAALEVLMNPTSRVVAKSHELVDGLAPLSRCEDATTLVGVRPPSAPEAEAVNRVRGELASAMARFQVGDYSAARLRTESAKRIASDLEYEPVQAEVVLQEAKVLDKVGEYTDARESILRAMAIGSRTEQWEVIHHAAILAMNVVGYRLQRLDEALSYWPLLDGVLQEDSDTAAEARRAYAALQYARGNFQGSAEQYRKVLAIQTRLLGEEHPKTLVAKDEVATSLSQLGEFEEAIALQRSAIDGVERVLSPEHPLVGMLRGNLGQTLELAGRLKEAEDDYRRALAIRRVGLGPDHPEAAVVAHNLSSLLEKRGRSVEAVRLARLAVSVAQPRLGCGHPHLETMRRNLGSALARENRLGEAEVVLRTSIACSQTLGGPRAPDVARGMMTLAFALQAQGKEDEAMSTLKTAREIYDARAEVSDEERAWLRIATAEVALERGEPEAARLEVEEAMALFDPRAHSLERAIRVGFLRARIGWELDGKVGRPGARELARRALDFATEAGYDTAAIQLWLSRHEL